jgi:hypothetical protein
MRYRKVIKKPVEVDEDGVQIAGAVNAVISATVNEPGSTHLSSRQKVRIVQRNGRTETYEETSTDEGGNDE